jgi:cytochrome c biogenesis protein CcmG/thiol:disulfide interchange protein DsbE
LALFRTGKREKEPRSVVGRVIDYGLWLIVLGLLAWRFGPQLLAVTGLAGGEGPAPPFEVTTLDGRLISSDSLAGKVVLVNFWATWCPPCRLEMPGIERVWQARRQDGFVVLGLSTDQTGADGVRAFLQERGVTYPIAMATPSIVRAFGGYRGLPTSFLIDRDGTIRYRITGFYAEPALRAAVSRLLSAPAGGPPAP